MNRTKFLFIFFIFIISLIFNSALLYSQKSSEDDNEPFLDKFDSEETDEENEGEYTLPQSNRSRIIPSNQILPNGSENEPPISIADEIKKTLAYGTYQEQTKIFTRLSSGCRHEDSELNRENVNIGVNSLEENGFFDNPFRNDSELLLTVVDFIAKCNLFNKKKLIEQLLIEETKYRNHPDIIKAQLKIKALTAINSFYEHITDIERTNYAKLIEQYYQYDRYHDDNWKIKEAVLLAAGKYQPQGFNKVLKRDYSKEPNPDLKNSMIQIIGLYRKTNDIDFLDSIVKNEEESTYRRWIAVVAFTNYAPNPIALKKVKEYIKMPQSDIIARGYYVLSFYDLDIDFFVEASKNNDENIRLQAVQALAKFPLPEVKEILEYKSSRDSSPRVRKEAEKILNQKIAP